MIPAYPRVPAGEASLADLGRSWPGAGGRPPCGGVHPPAGNHLGL